LLSYFRLSINHNDDESLKRIINYPARGIGQTTLDKIMIAAMEHDISMWQVITNLKDFNTGINSGTAAKIEEFTTSITSFSLIIPYKTAFDSANYIAVTSGVVKDLYHDKTPEGVSRYENIQELLNGIKDFTEQDRTPQEEELKEAIIQNTEATPTELFDAPEQANALKTLDEFMQEITLLTDVDKEGEDEKNADKVTMMTIHASKGLEFPYVHIVGLEENLFPSQMALNSRSELEEERRLFYVAITRAEKKATISFATTRYRFGNIIYCEPSRFIDELDVTCVDYPDEPVANKFSDNAFNRINNNNSFGGSLNKSFDFKGKSNDEERSVPKPINFAPPKKLIPLTQRMAATNTPVDNSANANLRVGSVVEHEKFGIGEITAIEGVYPEAKASIQFKNSGEKNLLLKYAKLKIVL